MNELNELRRKANSIAELCGLLIAADQQSLTTLQLSVQSGDIQFAIPLVADDNAAVRELILAKLQSLSHDLSVTVEQLQQAVLGRLPPAPAQPARGPTGMWYERMTNEPFG